MTFQTRFINSDIRKTMQRTGDIPVQITVGPLAPPHNKLQMLVGLLGTKMDNTPVNVVEVSCACVCVCVSESITTHPATPVPVPHRRRSTVYDPATPCPCAAISPSASGSSLQICAAWD